MRDKRNLRRFLRKIKKIKKIEDTIFNLRLVHIRTERELSILWDEIDGDKLVIEHELVEIEKKLPEENLGYL